MPNTTESAHAIHLALTRVLLSPSGRGVGEASFLCFRVGFRFDCQTQRNDQGIDFTRLSDRVASARVGEVEQGWERLKAGQLIDRGDFSADVVALTVEDGDLANPPPHMAGWRMRTHALESRRGFGGASGWKLCWGSGARATALQFRFLEVGLTLFDTGLGYLTFHVQPSSDALGAWHDMLHHFRFFDGHRGVTLLPPPAAAGADGAGSADASPTPCNLAERVRQLLRCIGESQGVPPEALDTWAEFADRSGQLHAFGGVTLLDSPEDAETRHRVLNRFVELAPQSRPLDPVPSDSETARRELLQYNERAWFVASKDMALFVAFDPDRGRAAEFFRTSMPGHLRRTYLTIDLFTQYQWQCIETIRAKTILATSELQRRLVASPDAAARRRDLRRRREKVEALLETVMAVRARGFFTEITRRRNHARFERFLRSVTRIDEMHRIAIDGAEAVGKWVVESHRDAERKVRERGDEARNILLTFLTMATIFGLPLQVVSSILSINIRDFTGSKREGAGPWTITAIMGGVTLGSVALAWWLWRVYRRTAGPDSRDR